ncbi:MAG: CatB-related O-acetyltransferase [Muribaculaceae bacterium]
MDPSPQIAPSAITTNSNIGNYCSIGSNTRFCYSSLGDFSYVSVNSNIFSSKIGKFSSISWNVSINPAKHDYNRITQHPILFAKKYGMCPNDVPFYRQYDECKIGNDCWIGCNVLIMGGITIGDGAIIGANSRITRDVPPYSIMIGNNNHLRNRFSDEIVEHLLSLKWWDMPYAWIKQNIKLLAETPTIDNIRLLQALIVSA